jgi:DNA-binding NarL/FixJ family response regulator
MARDVIAVVEAAYLHDAPDTWHEHVVARVAEHLGDGLGAFFLPYDMSKPGLFGAAVLGGVEPRIVDAILLSFAQATPEQRRISFDSAGKAISLSHIYGPTVRTSPAFAAIAGLVDVCGTRVGNPDGTGMFVGIPMRKSRLASAHLLWQVGVHLAAARRLQRALDADAEAVLAPDGRLLHAEGVARSRREALERACRRVDRARGAKRRADPTAALDAWTALADGRWSLVDRFESDGRRFVVALPNAPDLRDPRALDEGERRVVHYVVSGCSNKVVAYTLGIPEGSVATVLKRAMRKLGVRTRVQLIAHHDAIRAARFAIVHANGQPIVVGEAPPSHHTRDVAQLTSAQREVAELAARGLSNDDIARRRACAPRTVANLLVAAYRRLGVGSRAELACALRDRAAQPT